MKKLHISKLTVVAYNEVFLEENKKEYPFVVISFLAKWKFVLYF
jgi:hypothetical protein